MKKVFLRLTTIVLLSTFALPQSAFALAPNFESNLPAPATATGNSTRNSVSELPQLQDQRSAVGKPAPTRSAALRKKRTHAKRDQQQFAHHAARPDDRGDCDQCHNQCLIGSLACIAISAVTGCAPCGLICLGAQAACGASCNRTSACQAVAEAPITN